MVESITNWLIASGCIDSGSRDIVRYGLEQGIFSIIGISVTIITGYFLNVLVQSIIFIVTLIPLRIYAGGYHASTRKRCTVFSALLMYVAIWWIAHWYLSEIQSFVLGFVEFVILFFLIPIEGTEKLQIIEKKTYRKNGRIVILIEMTLLIWMRNNRLLVNPLVAMLSIILFLSVYGKIKSIPS